MPLPDKSQLFVYMQSICVHTECSFYYCRNSWKGKWLSEWMTCVYSSLSLSLSLSLNHIHTHYYRNNWKGKWLPEWVTCVYSSLSLSLALSFSLSITSTHIGVSFDFPHKIGNNTYPNTHTWSRSHWRHSANISGTSVSCDIMLGGPVQLKDSNWITTKRMGTWEIMCQTNHTHIRMYVHVAGLLKEISWLCVSDTISPSPVLSLCVRINNSSDI